MRHRTSWPAALGRAALLLLAWGAAPRAQEIDPLSLEPAGHDSSATARGYTPTVHVTAPRLDGAAVPAGQDLHALSHADIASLPALHAGELLQSVPGLFLFDTTGSGSRFVLGMRGFTAAGEGEYVELRLDGIPANELQKGLADFNLLPPAQLGRIEVLRGPASARYGERATAGVVHLVSQPRLAPWLATRTGSFGQLGIESGSGLQGERGYLGASLGWMRTDGWRRNSEWEEGRVFGRGALRLGAGHILGASLLASRHERGEPGPLPRALLVGAPEEAFFPRDREEVDRLLGGLRFGSGGDGTLQHAERLWVRLRRADLRRSLAAGLESIETRREELDETSLGGEAQATVQLGGRQSLQVGIEVERGALEDTDHAEGDTAVAAAAAVRRVLLAPYVQSLTRLPADLVLSLGARYDAFHLRFDQTAGGAGRSRRDLSRWSPRTALAWKRRRAEVWLAGSGVFKIPTLDQLYDLRHPFGLPLSNPDLQPQHGTSVEIGLRLEPRPTTRADVTLYRIRMRDEISFDAARFVYANVGRSDHDGAEIGVAHRWSGWLETAASYTWTDAVFRSGSVNGNRVHGIPEHRGRLDLQLALPLRLGLALTLEANGAQPLDEANTRELRGFATTSARLRRAFRHLDAWVQVDDLFDERHAASGYVLPFDGAELLYPAGARRFALGLELRR